MKQNILSYNQSKNPNYNLTSPRLILKATIKPPVIVGKKKGELKYKKETCSKGKFGGMSGEIFETVFSCDDLEITRYLFLSEDKKYFALKASLKNTSKKTFCLHNLIPFCTQGDDSLNIAGAGIKDWRFVSIGRMKSDIPSGYRLDIDDHNLKHALYNSVGRTAGMGASDADQSNVDRNIVSSDPCTFIKSCSNEDAPGFFMGIVGQNKHMSRIDITSNGPNELKEIAYICEFDGVKVDPEEIRDTHWFVLHEFIDETSVLEEYAEIVAAELKIKKPQKPALNIFCSWQYWSREFYEKDVDETLKLINKNNIPIDVLQLDNGWFDYEGDYNPGFRFPKGMKNFAETTRKAGVLPGLWTCPLIINKDSKMYKKYPDLVLKDNDGNDIPFRTDGDNFAIDPTSLNFKKYLESVYSKFRDWGIYYHKLDFLRAVFLNENARFADPKVNRAQAFEIAMTSLREVLGEDAYINSCGGMSSVGNLPACDSCRTSSDTYSYWKKGHDTNEYFIRFKQNILRNYSNRFWRTDPDAAAIRRQKNPNSDTNHAIHLSVGLLNDEEAFTVLAGQYLGGGNCVMCDPLEDIDDDRLAMLRHTIPSLAIPAKILNFDYSICPNFFLSKIKPRGKKLKNWWTLAVTNFEDHSVSTEIDLNKLGLPAEITNVAIFEFYRQEYIGVHQISDKININLPPHGTRLLRIAPWCSKKPIILGTDLHLSGGGYELDEIKITSKKISGIVKTKWKYPVKITALFPYKDEEKLRNVIVYPSNEKFEISL